MVPPELPEAGLVPEVGQGGESLDNEPAEDHVIAGILALVAAALGAVPEEYPGGPAAVVWDERIEVASGRAYRGPWRMNDSRFLYVDDPSVAVDEDGAVGVAWVDQTRKDVLFQVFAPDGGRELEDPVNVSRSARVFSWLPRVVMTSGDPGKVFVLWQEIVFSGGSHGGEIFFARSTDGGRSFERPKNLSNSRAGDGKGRLTERRWHNGSLDLARGAEGMLYAAWTEYEGALWLSRSEDRGRSFSAPIRVAGGQDEPARGPSVAVGPEGAVFLAWTVGEDPEADIRVAISRDRGRSFGEPRIPFPSRGHSDAPKLAVDGGGTVHLVFAESPDGPFRRSHVLYTRWDGGEDGFDEIRRLSPADEEGSGGASFPGLSRGAEDQLFVLWEHHPVPGTRPRGLGFTYSTDGGRSFAPPAVIPGTSEPELGANGSQQGLLMRKLAANRSGHLAVVNSTFRKGERSSVWLYRDRVHTGRPAPSPDEDPQVR